MQKRQRGRRSGSRIAMDYLRLQCISTVHRWATGNCMHIATNYHVGGRNKKQFIIIVQKALRD